MTLLEAAANPGGLSAGWRTPGGRAVEAGMKGFWYQVGGTGGGGGSGKSGGGGTGGGNGVGLVSGGGGWGGGWVEGAAVERRLWMG